MNIFVVDKDPVIAAQSLMNKHVIKMILESAQMLCSVIHQDAPYKKTHVNHPCSIWARTSKPNFDWLVQHALALNDEYRFRYDKKVDHKSTDVIKWCVANLDREFKHDCLTPFAQAMPEQYQNEDAVIAYRAYYVGEKKNIAVWTRREPPSWFTNPTL